MTTEPKILIANRGEIACRVARTAAAMGYATVGVYTEADARALHADSMDIAASVPSYLDRAAIIDAATRVGAGLIHPGYGFLSENAEFAEQVTAAGLIWVGPTPEQIRLLGDKIAAKQAAIDAGVPTTTALTVSGDRVPDELPEFPVLVKAAAGGGGRGMRVVETADELGSAIESARREAESAFGDGTVFIEPYIARGRHIEVQVLGDTHGNVIHLGDRECSIQRRNQKIVEEAPSPGIDDNTRMRLREAAAALARSVGYVGAGTVEFMVSDTSGEPTINFLEVNTRLQVEHPVTEAITGIDLVEQQIKVALGETLSFTQAEVDFAGHAIEVRLVAEDPAEGWLPSTGTLSQFEISAAGAIRVDTGVRAGSVVSTDYDSMLAKVISHDADRSVAARRLARALRTARIAGVTTNAEMLAATLTERDFLSGATVTRYLDEHPDVLTADGPEGEDRAAHLIALALADRASRYTGVTSFAPPGWRNLRTQGNRVGWRTGREEHQLEYEDRGDRLIVLHGTPPEIADDGSLAVDERSRHEVQLLSIDDGQVTIDVDGLRRVVDVELGDPAITADASGTLQWQRVPRFSDPDTAVAAGQGPVSPLPGTVISVSVAAGDLVDDGDLLMVVEAMKMEHRITASAPASVAEVHFAEGDRVDAGDLLVTLDTTDD